MKRTVCLVFTLILVILCTSCNNKPVEIQPQASQMRSICEFATLDCYYHTVAKYYEENAEGVIWKKDRRFWVEYTGIVTVGIDASLLAIDINGDNVRITLPKAEIQSCKVDENSLTEESFIVDKKSADVQAEHQQAAFQEAQMKLEEAAKNDATLLMSAQNRAKELLTNYINYIGDLLGKKYVITFSDIEENPQISNPATEENITNEKDE